MLTIQAVWLTQNILIITEILLLAIKRHAFYIAFVLMDDMKGIQLNIKNNDGKTPIDLAKGLIAYSGEDIDSFTSRKSYLINTLKQRKG